MSKKKKTPNEDAADLPDHHRTPNDLDIVNPLYELEGYSEDGGDHEGGAAHYGVANTPGLTSEIGVDFDWSEIEETEAEDPKVLADRVVADCLAWVMSFCLSGAQSLGTRGAQSVAFRRFVALAYIYRPDLIKGRTIRQIAAEIEVSHQAVNRYISEISIELGASGVNQNDVNYRVECRLHQLRARTSASDPPPDPPADP